MTDREQELQTLLDRADAVLEQDQRALKAAEVEIERLTRANGVLTAQVSALRELGIEDKAERERLQKSIDACAQGMAVCWETQRDRMQAVLDKITLIVQEHPCGHDKDKVPWCACCRVGYALEDLSKPSPPT